MNSTSKVSQMTAADPNLATSSSSVMIHGDVEVSPRNFGPLHSQGPDAIEAQLAPQ